MEISAIFSMVSAGFVAVCTICTVYLQYAKNKELNTINRMFEYKAKYYGEFFDSVSAASHLGRTSEDARPLIANMLKAATFANGDAYVKVLEILKSFSEDRHYDSAKLALECVRIFREDLDNCLKGEISPQNVEPNSLPLEQDKKKAHQSDCSLKN